MTDKKTPDLKKIKRLIVKDLEVPRTLSSATNMIEQLVAEYSLTKGQKEKLLFIIREKGILEPISITWSNTIREQKIVTSEAQVDPFQLGLVIQPNSYYCFAAALYCLGLISDVPELLDVAKERRNYSHSKVEDINAIDFLKEFQKSPRISSRIVQFKTYKFRFMEREESLNPGLVIVQSRFDKTKSIRTASLERTLIDCAVSPHYIGGFKNVVNVYNKLKIKNEIDVAAVYDVYSSLVLRYPYWQRIGLLFKLTFGAEISSQWKKYVGLPQQKFFAEKEAQTTWIYDEEWKIAYPQSDLEV